ncbi:L,D-transpeptidase family protein [Muricoccus vinaceus]|uniref:L,D-transpeptidase family protein n=1 Tax=Muricoccus vinaceus TaxID=424704 RepID=A0ABV6J283_9PROT
MHQTRRSLAAHILAALSPAPFAKPALAQGLPATGAEIRGLLQRARDSSNTSATRLRLAAERTLERMDNLGLDHGSGPGGGRVVVVNIAAAELVAYEEGREVLRSRIVVGAARTRTPQLATFVTSVRTNPPWYVPASIEPEIRAAGAVGFRVVNGRLIQPPGPANPLGAVRIGLLDSDGIFLHGTSAPALFARPDRALSHGCVRVERVRDLAAWVAGSTPAAMQAMLATGRTLELPPPQEVQVVLGYFTAWPNAAGRVVAHADPYGLDAAGSRRAAFRRVPRPAPQSPAEAEDAARPPPQEDNPL